MTMLLRVPRVLAAFALIACSLALGGCASVYSADEERSAVRAFGEPAEVEVQFNFLVFYGRAPTCCASPPRAWPNDRSTDRRFPALT